MSRIARYFLNGFRSGMIIGTPDFETNNQYTDMINIGEDMRTGITKVVHATRESTDQSLRADRNSYRKRRVRK